jgi:ABC-type antimicrobial peptide transport system permease subunit
MFNFASQADQLSGVLLLTRIQMFAYGMIGVFGLLLAAVGLAGVTGYAVAQRTKEIGIRVALGAGRFQILQLVGREALLLIITGTVAGEAAALALTRLFNAWFVRLYEITRRSSSDPILIIGVPIMLATLTMFACYLPARRALRIDSAAAIRNE